jgi:TonB family protein
MRERLVVIDRLRQRPQLQVVWGKAWRIDPTWFHSRVRLATIVSIAFHLCLIGALLIRFPKRDHGPVKFTSIPVNLVRVHTPRSIGSHRAGDATIRSRLEAEAKKPKPVPPPPKATPTNVANARPVPSKKLKPHDRSAPQDTTAAAKPILHEDVALGGGVQGALDMTVDGPISAYTYYLMTVRDKVASKWDPSGATGKEVSTIINFRIDRVGKVTASYVEEPSGNAAFDTASLRAVVESSPFPPLPQEYVGDWLGIHLRFVYNE